MEPSSGGTADPAGAAAPPDSLAGIDMNLLLQDFRSPETAQAASGAELREPRQEHATPPVEPTMSTLEMINSPPDSGEDGSGKAGDGAAASEASAPAAVKLS